MRYAIAATTPGGADVLTKIDLGDVTAGAGEVVIRHDAIGVNFICLLYTSPSPRDRQKSRMPSSA